MSGKLKKWVFAINATGFAVFLAWLASMSDRQLLREQDGILYFLPCLPFLFVFVLLLEPRKKKEGEKGEESGNGPEASGGKDGRNGEGAE